METLTYTGNPTRIDSRLTTQFSYSRSFFHHLIKSEIIQIQSQNRKTKHIPKKSYMLLDGDVIYIHKFLRYIDGINLNESPRRDIDIRYECDDYIVIHKPKGVLSHPTNTRNISVPSVVGALYHYHKNNKSLEGLETKVSLIHRLDMDTDGYMILAKTTSAYTYYKNLFHLKSNKSSLPAKERIPLHKYYRAICEISREGALFLKNIEQDLPVYIQEIVNPNVPYTEPKIGITKVISVTYIQERSHIYAQIECEILTGRTHQVRCHLANKGLPIAGDTRYGATETNDYIQLTAYKLEFKDIYGEMKVFG